MITIDGSQGEGGGQILRTSLALSLVTGRTIEIVKIRAGRKRPGLMRQHLTAVRAAGEVGRAEVSGDQVGSTSLRFRPETIQTGTFNWSVGTAGSTTLVLQTVLPALMVGEGDSEVAISGGTHNPGAPPFEFLARSFAPLLERLGPRVEPLADCLPGFFPAGGGRCAFRVTDGQPWRSLELLERGPLRGRSVRALVNNLPRHIGERECRLIARKTGWPSDCFHCEEVDGSPGPGNVVLIELQYEHVTEVFVGFGEVGKKAEQVAAEALRAAREYQAAEVPVGKYLADQLMLPMALAAHYGKPGRFRTLSLSNHSETQLLILRRFLDVRIHVDRDDRRNCTVSFA